MEHLKYITHTTPRASAPERGVSRGSQRSNASRVRSFCVIPATNSPYKVLNFPKAFALKPKVNAAPGKLRFIRSLWMRSFIILLH